MKFIFHSTSLFPMYVYTFFLGLLVEYKRIVGILLLCCLLFSSAYSQSLLNKRISLSVQNERIEEVLTQIEKLGGFRFAYNLELVPINKRVSIEAKGQRLKNILEQFLPAHQYEFQEIQQHIIISSIIARSVEDSPLLINQPPLAVFRLSGKVQHAETGKGIQGVNIQVHPQDYQIESNRLGKYGFAFKAETQSLKLSFTHPTYHPYTTRIDLSGDTELNIQLCPIVIESIPVEPVKMTSMDSINRVEDVFLVKLLVNKKLLKEDISPDSIEARPFQFSFLPLLGTNGFKTGKISNSLSFNLLVGYAAGLNGIEVAGLLNVERYEANGIQIAGLGNVVGGSSSGLQLAGLSNINRHSVNGFQIAGINNFADSLKGGQISGLNNILRGQLIGVQASGIFNFANGNIEGVELAGVGNLATKGVYGLQVAGVFNAAKTIQGVQLSPLLNVTSKDMSGIQVGLVNIAGEVRGFQFGLVNIADTVVWGAPIGLINIVKNGYNHFEFSTSDIFLGQIRLKLGAKRFHNIFGLSYHPEMDNKRWAMSYGFGSAFDLGKRFGINTDFLYSHVNEGIFTAKVNELLQLNLSTTFKFKKRLQLFVGPSFNLHISEKQADGMPVSQLAPRNLIDFSTRNAQNPIQLFAWLGWQFGIRI